MATAGGPVPIVVAGEGRTHHVSIGSFNSDDYDPTEQMGLILTSTEDTPPFVGSLEPALAPQQFQASDGLNPTAQPPERDLVWIIPSFHGGGLQYRVEPGAESRYNTSNGVDVNEPGELGMLNKVHRVGFKLTSDAGSEDLPLTDPGFSNFTPVGTYKGVRRTASSAIATGSWLVRTNGYLGHQAGASSRPVGFSQNPRGQLSIAVYNPQWQSSSSDFEYWWSDSGRALPGGGTSSVANERILSQALTFKNSWRSKHVTISVRIHVNQRIVPEDGDPALAIYIDDGRSITEKAVHVQRSGDAEWDWAVVSAVKQLASNANKLEVGIRATNNNGHSVVSVAGETGARNDWLEIFSVDSFEATLGFTYGSDGIKPTTATEYKNKLYVASGPTLYEYDKDDDEFTLKHTANDTIKGLAVMPGEGGQFVLGYSGSSLKHTTDFKTWTEQNNVPAGPYAVVGERLWAIHNNSLVQSQADITSDTTWTGYNYFGSHSRKLNGIYAVNDTVVVGGADGLWFYARAASDLSAADRFRNVIPELKASPHPDHFTSGGTFLGQLYLPLRYGLVRTNGIDTYEELTPIFHGQRLVEYSGRIRAITADAYIGYLLMDTPNNQGTWLLAFDILGDGATAVRPMSLIPKGELTVASVFYDGTNTNLLMLGVANRIPVAYRMRLPTRHESHSRDVDHEPDTDESAELVTSWWDGGFEREPKFPKEFRCITENCHRDTGNDDLRTIQVHVQYDEDDLPWWKLGTITGNGARELTFEHIQLDNPDAPQFFYRMRYRFTLVTKTSDKSPRMLMPVYTHVTYRPRRLKRFEMLAQLGPQELLNGGWDTSSASAQVKELVKYVNSPRPVKLYEDDDGDGDVTKHIVFLTDVQYHKVKLRDYPENSPLLLYRITAIEAWPQFDNTGVNIGGDYPFYELSYTPVPPGELDPEAGDKQVKLTWGSVVGAVDTWEYRYRDYPLDNTEENDGWSAWATAASLGTGRTYTVTGLTNGTEYGFQVRAKYLDHEGTPSTEVRATPATAPIATPLPYGGSQPVAIDSGGLGFRWKYDNRNSVDSWEMRFRRIANTRSPIDIQSKQATSSRAISPHYQWVRDGDSDSNGWRTVDITRATVDGNTTTNYVFVDYFLIYNSYYQVEVRAKHGSDYSTTLELSNGNVPGLTPTTKGTAHYFLGWTEVTTSDAAKAYEAQAGLFSFSSYNHINIRHMIVVPRSGTASNRRTRFILKNAAQGVWKFRLWTPKRHKFDSHLRVRAADGSPVAELPDSANRNETGEWTNDSPAKPYFNLATNEPSTFGHASDETEVDNNAGSNQLIFDIEDWRTSGSGNVLEAILEIQPPRD